MEKNTKAVVHEGMGMGTSIFFKYGYKDGHCSTYPLGTHCHPYLLVLVGQETKIKYEIRKINQTDDM